MGRLHPLSHRRSWNVLYGHKPRRGLYRWINKITNKVIVNDYLINGNGNKVDSRFNQAVLYKNCNDKENQINQILWALNITGFKCQYNSPMFYKSYQYEDNNVQLCYITLPL